jgi:lipid-binding SYLF domain-containing protein
MHAQLRKLLFLLLALPCASVFANDYRDTIRLFSHAGPSARFFKHCYGYAVFPTVGKGGLIVGGAHGKGRVYYRDGTYAGSSTLNQVSVGAQLGGQAYSEIIFFQDKAAFDKFTRKGFEFGLGVSAVAVTAGASAHTDTTGTSSSGGGTYSRTHTHGSYHLGMAVFTAVKGGLMFEASVGGQKFDFTPRKK